MKRTEQSEPDHHLDSVGQSLAEDPELSLREFWRRLWRRRGVIILGAIIGLALGASAGELLPPRFLTASSLLLFQHPDQLATATNGDSTTSSDAERLQDEIYVLLSHDLASKVIDRLALWDDPELAPPSGARGRLAALWCRAAMFSRSWGREANANPAAGSPQCAGAPRNPDRAQVVGEFSKRLDAVPEGRSHVIRVTFTSQDPKKAAAINNTLVDSYLKDRFAATQTWLHEANAKLNLAVDRLRDKMLASERAVESFRERAQLAYGRDRSIAAEQTAQQTAQVLTASSRRADAEAKLRVIEPYQSSPGGEQRIADVLQAPLIQQLRIQQVALQTRVAELESHYGASYPQVISAREELRQLHLAIAQEIEKIVSALRSEAKIASEQEAAHQRNRDVSERDLREHNRAEAQLAVLERDAETDRDVYKAMQERALSAAAQENLQSPGVQVISHAEVPTQAYFPPKGLLIAIGTTFGCLTGAAFGLALEQMESGVKSRRQLQEELAINVLGAVPDVRSYRKLASADSALLEAYRAILTALVFAYPHPPRILLVSSAVPREGKTCTVVSLALIAVESGQRTVVIDTDFHRPSAHRAFGISLTPGLSEFLAGKAEMEEIIHRTAAGVAFVPSGSRPENPFALLNNGRLKLLLHAFAAAQYLVLLDSAPVLAVSDPLVLIRQVDGVVLVVRWADTPKELAAAAVSELQQLGATIFGTILSMVDLQKSKAYGSIDSKIYKRVQQYHLRTPRAAGSRVFARGEPDERISARLAQRPKSPATSIERVDCQSTGASRA